MAAEPPSGRQIELRHAGQRVVVVEVGGGLREYTLDDRPLLDGYAEDEMADGGRGQPLLPWPNRVRDGQYEFDGQHLQLPLEEVARHNAIHGLTRWANWIVEDWSAERARLSLTVHPRPGYPFTLHLSIEYALSAAGLTVRTSAQNPGTRSLPFGAGQHPYLTLGTPLVDSISLQFGARARLELDADRGLPTGARLPVAGSEFDFRQPRPLGPQVLDECFSELDRDDGGVARVTLSHPGTGRAAVLWMDQHYRYLQAFSGDTLAAHRRRRGLALEPMTCPPDALRSGTDLIVLQPDQAISLEWGISP